MKIPRHVSITTTTVALALLVGVAVGAHSAISKPGTVPFGKASVTTLIEPAAPTSPAPAPTEPVATTSDPAPTPSSPQPAPTSAAADPTPPADTPAPVVATNASLADWTAPVADTRPNAAPNGTIQYRYCVYTYSDGSTRQRLYQTKNYWPGITSVDDPAFDCTVATAP